MVTGGAGFIGSALVRRLVADGETQTLNFDALTYAGNTHSLPDPRKTQHYRFIKGDIRDHASLNGAISAFKPDTIMNLAAETHVDRSITGPQAFIDTNIAGTATLLEAARTYWETLDDTRRQSFRLHQISTDEVFGSLGPTGRFSETTPYAPNSPYSASKASADHLVRAWHHTYGLPVLISNCTNNYGPYQYPEKFIPRVIVNALAGVDIPVYGTGENVRDWLYVDDHVDALLAVAGRGEPGETYAIGASEEHTNIDIANRICALLDEMRPRGSGSYADLITHVTDRAGHDARYAIDATKARREPGWQPRETFETGLRRTVLWYLENQHWWAPLLDREA
ncbi:dTDP-glucose 4,6-dehydratase [Pyruvatibacter mobilis]|uniref:dTDP-glucose 4,6-dehydratase n=1 Tax=Pyruvatibacter mobilis TaxID=1712261 RepID=UPI003BB1319C